MYRFEYIKKHDVWKLMCGSVWSGVVWKFGQGRFGFGVRGWP